MALSMTGLRCLVEIVDAGMNVSAAAQILHLSQPAVSRQLAQAEEALGFRLFSRRGRALARLTPAGEEVLRVARRMVADHERLRRLAGERRGEGVGELLIAAPQGYALHVLPPLLRRLCDDFAALSVRLRTLGEGEPLSAQQLADSDLALVSSAVDEPVEPGAIPLFRWKRVAIVERGHPLAAQRGPLTLSELARWPLVTYEAARRPDASFLRRCSEAGAEPQFACSAEDPATLKAYTRVGLGVGVVAEFSLSGADLDEFAMIELDPRLPECIAWAVLPRGRPAKAPTRALLALLAPHIEPETLRAMIDGLAPGSRVQPPSFQGLARR